MKRAKELPRKQNLAIANIALRFGFSSQSFFSAFHTEKYLCSINRHISVIFIF
ncbi:hypothetical protein IQ255_08480 [Pleurocapsales cyanobacterium LEGE 10410]|nr:hypothetical protein [Pleurocapsales cyanobacterium LEGE 10410]